MTTAYGTHLRRWLLSLPPVEFLIARLRELLIDSLRCGPIPQHVAFVMDGNRRYARARNLETVEGHNLGFEALARILEVCYKSGVKVVTIYAFSIENFKRSKWEVEALMDMAKTKLIQMAQHGEIFDRYEAQLRILGDQSLLRNDVLKRVEQAVQMTAHNKKAVLNVCFPYTGREEITHAVRETVRELQVPQQSLYGILSSGSRLRRPVRSDVSTPPDELELDSANMLTTATTSLAFSDEELSDSSSREPPSSQTSLSSDVTPRKASTQPTAIPDIDCISETNITKNLYTYPAPPLDLLIRTSGVQRLSDFMLWQCHQDTEIHFLDCLWPEFDLWKFVPVLLEWQHNQRQARNAPGELKHRNREQLKQQ